MATRWRSNVKEPFGILDKLRQHFGGDDQCGEAPQFEQLEGRVLLSANPLSELAEQPQNREYMDNQATYMPLTQGEGVAPAALTGALDTTGPTISGISADKGVVRTFEYVYFTINATADEGIAAYQLTINGQAVYVYPTSGQSSYFTFSEAGTYELVATVTDKAGNVSTHVQSLEVAETPDIKAPVVSMSAGNNVFYNRNVPLTISVTDADSLEINWTAILVNNATGEERVLASGDRAVWNQLVETITVDGSYTLRVEAVDKGGNVTVAANTFTIDTVPPEVQVTYDRAEVGVVTFDVLATDTSGIRTWSMIVDNRWATMNAAGKAEHTFTAPGEYTIVTRVTDMAGNVTTLNQTIVIGENTDRVGPAVEIVSPAANAHVNGSFDIVLTIADAGGEYVSWKVTTIGPSGTGTSHGVGRVDNQAVRTIYPSATDGPIRIIVEATDAAGNVTVVERSVTMDTTRPTVTNNFYDVFSPNVPLAKPFQVTGSVADTASPTSLISWKFTIINWETGAVVKEVAGQGNPPGGVFAEVDPAEFPYGEYAFTLEATDLAGNKTAQTVRNYMDGVAPSYTHSTVLDGDILRTYIQGTDNSGRQITYHLIQVLGPEGTSGAFSGSTDSGGSACMAITLNIPGVYVYEIYAFDWAGNRTPSDYFQVTYKPY